LALAIPQRDLAETPSLHHEILMQLAWTYWLENNGSTTGTVEMALDPTETYLVEGFLTKDNGGFYAHVYIAEVCRQDSSGQISCSALNPDPTESSIVATLSNAVSVTVALASSGNRRAEGVIWQL